MKTKKTSLFKAEGKRAADQKDPSQVVVVVERCGREVEVMGGKVKKEEKVWWMRRWCWW